MEIEALILVREIIGKKPPKYLQKMEYVQDDKITNV